MFFNKLKKSWYIHTMEYYSAIKRNGHGTRNNMMNLQGITLSKESQSQKVTNNMIPLYNILKMTKL